MEEEDSWGNWLSDLEVVMDDPVDECHANCLLEEEFLRDILQQPEGPTAPVAAPVLAAANANAAAAATGSSLFGQTQTSQLGRPGSMRNSSNYIMSQHTSEKPASSPTTRVLLSFDKSSTATALLPTSHDPCSANWEEASHQSRLGRGNPGTKKTRSASETIDHIISERNRRQELTTKFIALSATIPGLKKMDKAHVLKEAINYVKQLQERVRELEENIQKNGVESLITITRSHLCIDEGTTLCETNSNEQYSPNEALPEVEARVLGNEVLIKIHCGKQKGILLKILSQLERLHLSIASTNVLPFGDTLDITIIAQMGDKYSMILKDLVKNVRLVTMLKPCDVQQ